MEIMLNFLNQFDAETQHLILLMLLLRQVMATTKAKEKPNTQAKLVDPNTDTLS